MWDGDRICCWRRPGGGRISSYIINNLADTERGVHGYDIERSRALVPMLRRRQGTYFASSIRRPRLSLCTPRLSLPHGGEGCHLFSQALVHPVQCSVRCARSSRFLLSLAVSPCTTSAGKPPGIREHTTKKSRALPHLSATTSLES